MFLLACIAGCVGETTPPSGHGPPDARVPTLDARVDAALPDAAEIRCRNRVTTGLDSGHHNAGQDCQSGCHDHGFYMSGTLYSSASGGAPVSGASITFVDANGVIGDMLSGTNGNFWWTLPVAFPVTIIASSCPDIQRMTAMVSTADSRCNKGGCHAASGGAGRIHLP